MLKTIIVRRQKEIGSRQWGVYVYGQLVEGGFFTKAQAEVVAERIAEEMYGRNLETSK